MENKLVEGFRLSPQQLRLWRLAAQDGASAYRARFAFSLEGPLDGATLRASLEDLIARHEILRTGLQLFEGETEPTQVIAPRAEISFTRRDLSTLDAASQAAHVDRLLEDAPAAPSDFTPTPRIGTALLALAPERHVLFFDLPAFCADAASVGNLARELALSYKARAGGESPADEPVQYADLAEWQNELLESEEAEAGRNYWHRRDLSGLASVRLPFERTPSGEHRFAPRAFEQPFDASVIGRAAALASLHQTSLRVLLLACWQTLLWRLNGQTETVVGAAFDGRRYEELGGAVGLLSRCLPVDGPSADVPFADLLRRADEAEREARQRQEFFTWGRVAGEERKGGGVPFFPFAFEYEEEAARHRADGLSISVYRQDVCFDRFRLKLSCARREGVLAPRLCYDPEHFSDESVRCLSRQFHTLLDGVAARPDLPLSRLSLLGDFDRHLLLTEWNDTRADYSLERCLHQLFEEQVERTPEATAVVFEEEELSYSDLNGRANRLAHYLKRQGVGPESLVGVLMERSSELVVALLGVLKAGAAYLPLDPSYPRERLSFMLEDARPRVLLTQQHLSGVLPEREARVMPVDAEWESIGGEPAENPAPAATAENLAYVIYTSGSTGRPKGVMIPHRGICNRVLWMIHAFPFTSEDRVIQKTPFSFDAAGWEFFVPLLSGGRVIMARPGGHQDTAYLARVIAEQRVTVLQLVPSMLQVFLEEDGLENCDHLRRVYCGGEALPGSLHARFHGRLRAELHNLYGPTEASIDAACWRSTDETFQRTVPIGRALSNTRLFVLDTDLQPAPVGIPGELYIGGDGLARGYLNRPGLTAERFVPDPFSAEPGARLYRTGDLVRYLPTGDVEFLGRLDHQVKVRGFRIELGEIEAALCQHPGVREAVVVAREDAPGEKRLAAYVVWESEKSASADELRDYLKERLPEYMLPAFFVGLEAMPLAANGKVDRRSLPAPEQARPEQGKSFVAPRTEAEATLCELWSELLRVERVGVHDNFFELGGDSILGLQLVSRARKAGLRLTARQVFEHQTVAGLATVAGRGPAASADQGAMRGEVRLTPIQRYFFEQDVERPAHFNMAVMVSATAGLDTGALAAAVSELVRHHDALRMRFERAGANGWRQWCAAAGDGPPPFDVSDLSGVADSELRARIEAEAQRRQESLDLGRGPVLRAVYFELGEGRGSRLLLVAHHLVVDVVSWRVLLEDLQGIYLQLAGGGAARAREKTSSYKQWAERLHEYAGSEQLREEVPYWTDARRLSVRPVPVDSEGENLEATTQYVTSALPAELTEALIREVPRAYGTQLPEVLLAALSGAYEGWAGERLLLVDVEGHGREALFEDVDVTRTVGWFTSIYPLLLEAGGGGAGERLKSAKEQMRRVRHGGIGYGVLRYLTGGEAAARLRQQPEAEIAFNYLGRYEAAVSEVREAGLFGAATERVGGTRAGGAKRRYKLEINGSVMGGELRLSWGYSEALHRRETVERLAGMFTKELEALIEHCRGGGARGFTPSDFAEFKWDEADLENIAAAINKANGGA